MLKPRAYDDLAHLFTTYVSGWPLILDESGQVVIRRIQSWVLPFGYVPRLPPSGVMPWLQSLGVPGFSGRS